MDEPTPLEGSIEASPVSLTQMVSATPDHTLTIGDKVFMPIVLGKRDSKKNPGMKEPVIRMFSQKELRFLSKLMETRSIEVACFEVGIERVTAKKWIKREHFRAYIDEAYKRAALANATDVKEHMAWLHSVREGYIEPTESALEASKQLSRFLKPNTPMTAIQINNNNAGSPESSPYKGMGIDEIASEMKQRLAVIEANRKPA